jgi:uncharacterized repeat protein (TIGR01451 family)
MHIRISLRRYFLWSAFCLLLFSISQAAAQTPSVAKIFSPNLIAAGATSTLTITVSNGSIAATLAQNFVDTLPANVVIANPPNISGTCSVGSVTAIPGSGSVKLATGASIPIGGCTVSVNVAVNVPGSYLNVIPAGALHTDFGFVNPSSASAQLIVVSPPTVTKAFSPTTIAAGGTSTLTITLGNPNNSAATLTSAFTDTLPVNLVVASSPNIGGTCNIGSVTTTSGSLTLASGSSIPPAGCTLRADVTTNVPGTFVNTIPVGNLQTTFGNNPTPASATLNVIAPLTVSMQFNPMTVGLGQVSTLTIQITNPNSSVQTGMAFTDALPAGLVVAATTSNSCSGTLNPPGSSNVTLSGGTIPGNASCAISVGVSSASTGHFLNSMFPNAITTTQGTTNANTTTASLDVTAPQLSVTIDDTQTYARYGETLSYTITLSNSGNADANSVTVAETLAAAFDANSVQWTCVHGNDGTQCTASGTGLLSDSNVVIPASLSLAYVVTVPVLPDASGITADNTVNIVAPGDTNSPFIVTDGDILVIFHDSFE